MNCDIKVISLISDTSKRSEITSLMKKNGISFSFIDAVNGKKLNAGEYFIRSKNSNYKFNKKAFLTPSELGCFLSHKKALTEFVDSSSSDWLVVFEDDVNFDSRVTDLINNFTDTLHENYVYILGGQNGLKSINRVLFIGSIGTKYKFKKARLKTSRWIYRTCCYMINRHNAIEILELMKKGAYVSDNWNYIVDNTNIRNIAYLDLVSHPIVLSNSAIEQERLLMRS